MYASLEILKESGVIEEISNKVNGLLKQKGQTARFSSISKASKNAVSLWLSKKKGIKPTFLSIYLPMNIVESLCDTVVPNSSSDEDNSPINITENDSNISEDSQSQFSSSLSQNRHISLSFSDNLVTADVTFEYLLDYFKHSLSMNNKPMNFEKIVSDVCVYVFLELKCSVNIRALKNEISLQISHIVQAARVEAAGKIEVEPIMGFSQYRNNNYLSPILLIHKANEQIDILQFYPFANVVEITFNEFLIKKALSSFQLSRTLDINELISLVTECALIYNLNFDLPILEEALKTKVLFNNTSFTFSPFFLNVVLKFVQVHEVQTDFDQTPINDSFCYSIEEIDAIIGPTYITRGVKRSYEEDPILVEPNKNMHRQNKIKKDKRDLLHLKDTYHLTDSALNAIFQYVRSKKKLYSLKEIERLRKETNKKFPIIYTKTSAYVRFEYAVRTAIFVARKYEQKLEQFDILNIRFNMDGTLIGNKHIEYRQSCLRTTVTPYIHIIGNHLFEFDEFNNLEDYNMQGVEKNNDVLSNLYFSSTNPSKNPLLTMLQKLYRMLEMNFQDLCEREAMSMFAHTGVYDFVQEDLTDFDSYTEDHISFHASKTASNDEADSEEEDDLSTEEIENTDEIEDEKELEESMIWAPEKRILNKPLPRSENRFKSFRRS
ncbi:unnamed protein product [Rotaria sp. Silwood2]|nr:unnamed protein product [Rotaria sp. Silwood2]